MTQGFQTAMMAPGVEDILNITLMPFGNAVYNKTLGGKLVCQHGEMECLGNSLLQCAIDLYPNQARHTPFAMCFEKHGPDFWDHKDAEHVLSYAEECANEVFLDPVAIKSCATDPVRSAALQKKYYELTKLKRGAFPKVYYLTYVLVNGKKSPTDGAQLLDEVCAAYTGTKPVGCSTNTTTGAY